MFIDGKYDFLGIEMGNVAVVSTLLAPRGDDGQKGWSAQELYWVESGCRRKIRPFRIVRMTAQGTRAALWWAKGKRGQSY